MDPAKNESVHRLIQASTSFSRTWDWDALLVLDEGRVARRRHQPSIHYVYGTTRGRTIWGPAYLLKDYPKATLACQHRNLLFASLQAEGLVSLARATTDSSFVVGDYEAASRRAMAAVGGLYLGAGSTYKTGSVKAQIEANGSLPAINSLREHLRLEKL